MIILGRTSHRACNADYVITWQFGHIAIRAVSSSKIRFWVCFDCGYTSGTCNELN